MSKTAAEFLLERYDDVLRGAVGNLSLPVGEKTIIAGMALQMKKVVEFHQNWPVLVETPVEFEVDMMPDSFETVSYKMQKRMLWMTEQEYIKRFGKEPVTAPLIKMLLQSWTSHEDFNPDWL